MISGGIDLGGTKIEARLFDGPDAHTVVTRRIATPVSNYDAMLDALIEQIEWLFDNASGNREIPVGIAIPGIVDPHSGMVFTANIPASNHNIGDDLAARLKRHFVVVNDGMAFAVSEARQGAAQGYRSVMSLVLGTGVGGGFCMDGELTHRHGNLAVEVGHIALPASAIARHELPLWRCGCGRMACMETCISGTGLSNIAEFKLGTRLAAEQLIGDEHALVLDIWSDIAGECLLTIQLVLDPDCIVIGGGLSKLHNVTQRLSDALKHHALSKTGIPDIVIAQHGDSSGARGAALLAIKQ